MAVVRKRRASGAAGVSFTAMPVEHDDTGDWFLVTGSTPHVHDDGWVVFVSPNPVLLLVPRVEGWVASTSSTGAKVDLCANVAATGEGIEFVDVELDVVWRWGDRARVEDVDEFHALGLSPAEEAGYLADAERIRTCVDAGEPPLDPAFRQRLLDLTTPGDPLVSATWAAGVGPLLKDGVSGLVGPEWLERQREGAGWLLCGGSDRVTAVVWLDSEDGGRLLTRVDTPEGEAMASFLLEAVPHLRSFPAPPLRP